MGQLGAGLATIQARSPMGMDTRDESRALLDAFPGPLHPNSSRDKVSLLKSVVGPGMLRPLAWSDLSLWARSAVL